MVLRKCYTFAAVGLGNISGNISSSPSLIVRNTEKGLFPPIGVPIKEMGEMKNDSF